MSDTVYGLVDGVPTGMTKDQCIAQLEKELAEARAENESLEAENTKLKALVKAQEDYIRQPFNKEASRMALAKSALNRGEGEW